MNANLLRICHVVGSLNPSMGGLPKSVSAMACAQAKAGAEVAVLYFGEESEETSIRNAYGGFPGFDRVAWLRVDPSPLESWSAVRALNALERFRPGVIQTHGLWEPLLHRAHRNAVDRGIPFGLTPHSMLHPWQARNRRVAKWMLTRGLGWGRTWRRAAFVQALTEHEARIWRRVVPGRVEVIPNGVFSEECPAEPERVPEPWNDGPFVLFLARLHAQKAPEVLLDAFASLAAARPALGLVLAGPDYGLGERLRRRAYGLEIADRVWLPGQLEGDRKWSALRDCACFCLPSRSEGFSLSVLEAALAGAPCVVSESCDFPELAEAGGARNCRVEAASVARELNAVLDDPDGAWEMGTRARRLVEQQYTWSRVAERQLALYRELTA